MPEPWDTNVIQEHEEEPAKETKNERRRTQKVWRSGSQGKTC